MSFYYIFKKYRCIINDSTSHTENYWQTCEKAATVIFHFPDCWYFPLFLLSTPPVVSLVSFPRALLTVIFCVVISPKIKSTRDVIGIYPHTKFENVLANKQTKQINRAGYIRPPFRRRITATKWHIISSYRLQLPKLWLQHMPLSGC